jgi:DNA-binding transcriptional ArsR family regulator
MFPMLSFTALADPTRRGIIELLARGDRTAGEIVAVFSVSAPAISQHLKVLREAGLIKVQVAGQKRIQQINPAALREIEDWARRTRKFWEERLDDLERELRKEDEEAASRNQGEQNDDDDDNDN